MKKFINGILLIIILTFVIINQKEIINYIMVNFIYQHEIVVENPNEYKLDYDFHHLKEVTDFTPTNKNDLLNIIYTTLNNGWDNFTFFCDIKYLECINDVEVISNDSELLSSLNNFIHPYNSYNIIYINYNNLGKVTISFDKLYSDSEINILNEEVESIYKKIINDKMSDRDKILKIHDYIINNTVYDEKRADAITKGNNDTNSPFKSHKAIGPLKQGIGICGGYSDAMSLFLLKMNIPSLKISNDTHIWNLVKIDNKWYHLDLTWDDPVVNTKENKLIHNYFLITTEQLFSINNNHEFSKEIYKEALQ